MSNCPMQLREVQHYKSIHFHNNYNVEFSYSSVLKQKEPAQLSFSKWRSPSASLHPRGPRAEGMQSFVWLEMKMISNSMFWNHVSKNMTGMIPTSESSTAAKSAELYACIDHHGTLVRYETESLEFNRKFQYIFHRSIVHDSINNSHAQENVRKIQPQKIVRKFKRW